MKFNVDCTEFKKAVEKAVAVTPRTSALPILHCLRITTGNNEITISTTNIEQFLKINVPATVIESGECFVDKNDIKKVYGLTDMVMVDIENGKFTVRNSKKKSAVPVKDYTDEDAITYPEMKDEQLFIEMQECDFVNTLAALSISLGRDENNKMMCGYNLNGRANRITTLDGHRFTFRRMQSCFKTEFNVTMSGIVYNQLKKIVGKRKDENIKVYVDKKYILISGNDYQLCSRLYEGEYFDVDRMMPSIFDFSFDVNPKEIGKIGKEYAATIKGTLKPMYLVYSDKAASLKTGLFLNDYTTVDVVEEFDNIDGLNKDFIYGFNPEFIRDAMTLYDDAVTCNGIRSQRANNSMVTPLFFDNGEYLSCVLPVNIGDDMIERFNEFADAA